MKKNILITLLLIVFTAFTYGQDYTKWELEWNIGFPTGDFKDYIDESSLRGIEFGGSYEFETGVIAGGTMGYSAFFKETERITTVFDDGALTAKHFRDVYSYFFLAEGGYSFLQGSDIRPFLKLGIGAYYTEQNFQVGLLYLEDDSWDFGIRPEFGIQYFNTRSQVGVTINGKFNFVTDYGNDLNNFYYWTLGIGFLFRI